MLFVPFQLPPHSPPAAIINLSTRACSLLLLGNDQSMQRLLERGRRQLRRCNSVCQRHLNNDEKLRLAQRRAAAG
jgi:hypothetical protein